MTPFPFPNGRRAALSLTFDDARPSQVDHGLPLLAAHDVRATFYVKPRDLRTRLSGWREAVAAGHEIGNHTVLHPCTGNFHWARKHALEDYTLERIEAEIREADEAIGEALGVRPVTFAYPCGETCVGRGTGHRSYVPFVASRFVAARAYRDNLPNDPAFCDLAVLLSHGTDRRGFDELRELVERMIAHGRWLILVGHDILPDGGQQSTACTVLDRLCAYCRERSDTLIVDTVERLARHIAGIRARPAAGGPSP